ncbi:MAG: peptidase S10, partial [Gammaproteobacteria bacterium]
MTGERKSETASQEPSRRFESSGSLTIGGKKLTYSAVAAWQPLFEAEKEKAEIFHTYYRVGRRDPGKRALTFVFNGGPGAASAYLHVGAIGPRRVATNKDGSLPASPMRLVDNAETWLPFTDLVFVDPVGTGLSRAKREEQDEKGDKQAEQETFYWDVSNDLSALCDFITGFLSREKRWRSPVFVAGESYGGYRAARLVRQLQEQAGVGLSGAMLISPALEWDSLFSSRFNMLARALGIPSYAATARYHGRCRKAKDGESLAGFLERAEEYALETYLPAAARGDGRSDDEMKTAHAELADWIGLDSETVAKHNGRVGPRTFARELLRDRG